MFHGFRSALLIGFVVLMVASTMASANGYPKQPHGRERIVVGSNVQVIEQACVPTANHRLNIGHGDRCLCVDCSAKREFARGFNRGDAAGANQGFRDGLAGKASCAEIRDPLHRESRSYREGYIQAFGRAYGVAFDRGRNEHNRHCRSVHRLRTPW